MSTTEVVQGELLPDVYEATPVPSTLFGTSDPTLAMERMALMARLLVDVVRERKLVMKISGNEYLLAPGWAVLAGMTGLSPYTAWTRPLEDGTGYIARVEVRRVADGAVISAAEQVCTRSERSGRTPTSTRSWGWRRRAPRAVRSEARCSRSSSSRATREPRPRRWSRSRRRVAGPIPDEAKPTKEQAARIRELIAALADEHPDVDWRERAQEIAGVPGNMLTTTIAATVIEKLADEFDDEAEA